MCMVWLSARIDLMNQKAYAALSGDVLADRPTRATRDKMNGNHTTFFNPQPTRWLPPFSHKV